MQIKKGLGFPNKYFATQNKQMYIRLHCLRVLWSLSRCFPNLKIILRSGPSIFKFHLMRAVIFFFAQEVFEFAIATSRASWYQLAIFESDFSNPTSKILVGLLPNPTFSAKLRWMCILSSKGIMTHKGAGTLQPSLFCQSFHRLFLRPAKSGVFSNLFVDTARFLW